jgi:hypothetical protein
MVKASSTENPRTILDKRIITPPVYGKATCKYRRLPNHTRGSAFKSHRFESGSVVLVHRQ